MEVLLVDEDPVVAELAREACAAASPACSVRVLRHGREAASYFFARPKGGKAPPLPALVILDMSPSRGRGLELLQGIKTDEDLRATPVVVLSPTARSSDLRRLYLSGANSCIAKPPGRAELERIVQRLCMYWIGVNEPPPNASRLSSR